MSSDTNDGGDGGTGPGRISDVALVRLLAALPIALALALLAVVFGTAV